MDTKLVDELPSLPIGTAYVWSPQWLQILKKIRIDKKQTYDSSATPKVGQKMSRRDPAPLDLKEVEVRMSAIVEQAKANDPKLLKVELQRLKAELAKAQKPAPAPAAKTQTKTVEKAVLKDGQLKRAEALVEKLAGVFTKAGELQQSAKAMTDEIAAAIRKVNQPAPMQAVARVAPVAAAPVRRIATPRAPIEDRGEVANGQIGKGERKVLTAVAQYPDGADREQLTVLTGYKRSSRDTYLQRLSHNGYVQQSGDKIIATQEGVDALGSDFEPLPTGDQLREYWMNQLSGGEKSILEVLVSSWPNSLARETIDADAGYKRSSRDTYLQRLAARKLIEIVGRGEVKASDMLFEEAMV